MKIRYPIIASSVIIVATVIVNSSFSPIPWQAQNAISEALGVLLLISIFITIFTIALNIFRAIKGAVTRIPQGDGYRDEARRACEKVKPKKNKDVTPPWEG